MCYLYFERFKGYLMKLGLYYTKPTRPWFLTPFIIQAWMDDYKQMFYWYSPGIESKDSGDVSGNQSPYYLNYHLNFLVVILYLSWPDNSVFYIWFYIWLFFRWGALLIALHTELVPNYLFSVRAARTPWEVEV